MSVARVVAGVSFAGGGTGVSFACMLVRRGVIRMIYVSQGCVCVCFAGVSIAYSILEMVVVNRGG